MEVKKCIKCGKELPLTIECFGKAKANKDGFTGQCKDCRSKWGKRYFKENRVKVAEIQKKWNDKNKDQIAKIDKRYRDKNRDKLKVERKKWIEENKEEKSKYQKKWKMENREKCNIAEQKRRAKKFQLTNTLTLEQWESIKQDFNNKCAYCGETLPLAQEHFVPLSKCGEYTSNNIIPSCQSCNSSKYNEDFFIWYPNYKYYSVKRERFILKYLNYKDETQQLKLI